MLPLLRHVHVYSSPRCSGCFHQPLHGSSRAWPDSSRENETLFWHTCVPRGQTGDSVKTVRCQKTAAGINLAKCFAFARPCVGSMETVRRYAGNTLQTEMRVLHSLRSNTVRLTVTKSHLLDNNSFKSVRASPDVPRLRVPSRSGHVEEANNKRIRKWSSKSTFLFLSL